MDAPAVIDEATRAAMRFALRLTLSSPHSDQEQVLKGETDSRTSCAHGTRGRFTEAEVETLLLSVSPIAHPHDRTDAIVDQVEFYEAGDNHGWPSYRAAAAAPTDGDLALGISWRLTVPHTGSVVREIDGLWAQPVGEALVLPEPRAEQEPITDGLAYVVAGTMSIPMYDGVVPVAAIENSLVPRVYTDGGTELLTESEVDLLRRVMEALVAEDSAVLEEIGAYRSGGDPYLWVREYGDGARLVLQPGPVTEWDVDVMQVDTDPGISFLVVGVWTQQEGRSDLSLEINVSTDPDTGVVSGEFVDLHVM